MPFPRNPNQPPVPDKKGTGRLESAPTTPLSTPNAFGKDQFRASSALRSSFAAQSAPSGSLDQGKGRLAELHNELARAKATILEVRPKMAILKRAIRLNQRKIPEAALFQQVPMQEKLFTQQIATHLIAFPDAMRPAEIAMGQYEAAWAAMQSVEEILMTAQMGDPADILRTVAGVSVEKMRGQVFPLTSLFVHFETDPVLSRLFEPPYAPKARGTAPLDPNDAPPYRLTDLFRPRKRSTPEGP